MSRLMRVFKDLDIVEQLGSGMQRILEKYDKSVFEITPNFLVVTFMFNEPVNDTINIANDTINIANDTINIANDTINDLDTENEIINDKEKYILNILTKNPNITRNEISQISCVSTATVSRIINRLRELNIIERVGSNKTGYWKVKA